MWLIVMAAVLSAAAASLAVWAWMAWSWSLLKARRVVVQLEGDVAVSGVITARRGPLLVVDDVSVLTASASSRVDGSMVIDRARVMWIQRVA